MHIHRPDFRVIAEGDDAVALDLTLSEAVGALDAARAHGKRHVAIVHDCTRTVVDEEYARRWVERA